MSLRYGPPGDWVAWIFLLFAFARAILSNWMAVANRLHVAFLRFVCSRYICIHWEQHGIRRMGTIRRSAESAQGAFSCFSMKDLHGVIGVLVFLSLLFLLDVSRATSTPDADIDFVLVIYIQIYPPYLGPFIISAGLRCMLWDFACFVSFYFPSIFLYLIRENRLGRVGCLLFL